MIALQLPRARQTFAWALASSAIWLRHGNIWLNSIFFCLSFPLSLNRIAVGKRIPFDTFAIIPHNPPRCQTCICIFWIVFIFVCFLLWINYCARLIIVIKNQPRDAPTLSCANSSFWPMECRRAWQRSSHACRYQHSHLRTDRQSRHRARLSR